MTLTHEMNSQPNWHINTFRCGSQKVLCFWIKKYTEFVNIVFNNSSRHSYFSASVQLVCVEMGKRVFRGFTSQTKACSKKSFWDADVITLIKMTGENHFLKLDRITRIVPYRYFLIIHLINDPFLIADIICREPETKKKKNCGSSDFIFFLGESDVLLD